MVSKPLTNDELAHLRKAVGVKPRRKRVSTANLFYDGVCHAKYHDTVTAYLNHGCRCELARTLVRRYSKLGRALREPGQVCAVGTQRKARALMALGHTAEQITIAAGWSCTSTAVRRLAHTDQKYVHPNTAAGMQAAYDKLSMTVGTSNQVRVRARRSGYLPPLAWDDDTIDDPKARPAFATPLGGKGRDWIEQAIRMYKDGAGTAAIAKKLRLTRDTVSRALSEIAPSQQERFAQREQQAREMYRSGTSRKDVATKLGVSERTIERYLTGVKRPGTPLISKEEAREISARAETAIYNRQRARGQDDSYTRPVFHT